MIYLKYVIRLTIILKHYEFSIRFKTKEFFFQTRVLI